MHESATIICAAQQHWVPLKKKSAKPKILLMNMVIWRNFMQVVNLINQWMTWAPLTIKQDSHKIGEKNRCAAKWQNDFSLPSGSWGTACPHETLASWMTIAIKAKTTLLRRSELSWPAVCQLMDLIVQAKACYLERRFGRLSTWSTRWRQNITQYVAKSKDLTWF